MTARSRAGGLLPIWPQWEVWRKPKAATSFRFLHSGHIGHIGQTFFPRTRAREGAMAGNGWQFPSTARSSPKHLAGMDNQKGKVHHGG